MMARYAGYGAIAVFCALLPYLGILPAWTPPLATVTSFMALSLIGLNLIFGVTGMLALGQAAFVVLPGYGAGILQAQSVPGLVAIPLGVLIAVLIARLIAEIFIRLPGIYFAIGTLGFAFVVEGLARAFPSVTGGASGLVLIPPVALDRAGWYALAVVSVVCGALVYAFLVRDRFLRTLKLVRNDELAAQVLGVDVARVKVRVFTIGSAFSAVGGVLLAYYVQVLAPEGGGVNVSLEQLAMVIIGGAGSVLGPLLGAAVVQWLFAVAGGADRYELLVYGLGFFLVVLFAPAGIMGALRKLPLPFLGAPRGLGSGAAAQPAPDARPCDGLKAPAPALRHGVCLAVEGLSKNFGGLAAVADVGFEVRFGQVVALIGPNGAGKSTLFNLISGIEPPTAGRVLLEGRDMTDTSIHSRAGAIGRSFQVPRLVPELTALENVVSRLDHLPLDADEAERRRLARRQLDHLRPRRAGRPAGARDRPRLSQAHRACSRLGRATVAVAARRAGRRPDQGGDRPTDVRPRAPAPRRCRHPGGRAQRRVRRDHRRRARGARQRPAHRARRAPGRDRRSQGSGRLFWSADMSAMLEVKDLQGGYGNLSVFRNVDLVLEKQQTIGLVGANGAGKTTLLKTIVGSLPSAAGTVMLDGKAVTGLPAYRRTRAGVTLVPEGRHIFATLSVYDNLELTRAIEINRPDLEPFEQRLEEVYTLFPRLAERSAQLGGSLSGGEQQMLAIARALLLRPKVLMLDEPTQGLAPIVIGGLIDTLASLKGRFAILIVEQNRAFVERLADRLLFMRSGTVAPA